ncbi:hypothetical protein D3C87_1626450 [compost metagenome]
MHNSGSLVTQHAQGFGNRQHQFRAINADQRQWRTRWVDQRAEYVEYRTGFQLLTYRHRMAETGVILRREQEAYAQVIQRLARLFRRQIQTNAERRQQIG